MEEMKQCPFCGRPVNNPHVYLNSNNRFYVIVACTHCGVELKKACLDSGVKSINEAAKSVIEIWNGRA